MNKTNRRRGAQSVRKPPERTGNHYFTCLPTLTEGNNPPMEQRPGFAMTDNADPNGWLASCAHNINTPGTDVGYAIPDVMAGEQQVKRLIRLPHVEAMRHQEMRDWRAVLAILLLWDSWPKDEYWPELTLTDYLGQAQKSDDKPSAFRQALLNAVSRKRARGGLRLFALVRVTDLIEETCPLAVVSADAVIAPAANMQERVLKRLLPGNVTWYDREKNRFEDPVRHLRDLDRLRLLMQLRILQQLNMDQALGSELYAGENNHLVGLLDQYMQDLIDYRYEWRNGVNHGEEEPLRQLYLRIAAVKGLYRDGEAPHISSIRREVYHLNVDALLQNPLICSLIGSAGEARDGASMAKLLEARGVKSTRHVYYVYRGTPFAREDGSYLLEPMNDPGEAEAMRALELEIGMMRDYSSVWNQEFGRTLHALAEETRLRVGANRMIADWLETWGRERMAVPRNANRTITLAYPLEGQPETLQALMQEYLDMESLNIIYNVFSDSLLVICGPEDAPLPYAEGLAQRLRVHGDVPEGEAHYGVIPMSEDMANWLMAGRPGAQSGAAGPRALRHQAPCFVPELLELKRTDGENGDYSIHAAYAVRRVSYGATAIVERTVRFEKIYTFHKNAAQADLTRDDLIEEKRREELPAVLSWPNVMLPPDQWKLYWLYATRETSLTLWAVKGENWLNLSASQRVGPLGGRFMLMTDRFPRYLMLKRGGVMCGVLYNPAQPAALRADDAITAAVDFGSTATAVMLQQGRRMFPALFDRALHARLLYNGEDLDGRLYDEFIPEGALRSDSDDPQANVYASSLEVFTYDHAQWVEPLVDGHIYFYPGSEAYRAKNKDFLYYNLKWGQEVYRQNGVALFLRQSLIQTSLIARLHGAPSIAWRFSIPTALPGGQWRFYLECVTDLADEVARLTGLPLQSADAVTYLSENGADGAFFLHEDMVDVRNGYINMDIGGGTCDLSLWLGGADVPAEEHSLDLGSRSILFDSIAINRDRFAADFAALQPGPMADDLQQFLNSLAGARNQPRKRDMAMFLMDRWLGQYAESAVALLRGPSASGAPAYMVALVTLAFSFLYFLCGELLAHAYRLPEEREKLGDTIQVCFAGNGGQLYRFLNPQQQERVRRFAALCLEPGQPPITLVGVLSPRPKQEIAIGLLYSTRTSDMKTLENRHATAAAPAAAAAAQADSRRLEQFQAFFRLFIELFPQESALLLEEAICAENGETGLSTDAAYLLRTVVNNQFASDGSDLFVKLTNCWLDLKKAWRV